MGTVLLNRRCLCHPGADVFETGALTCDFHRKTPEALSFTQENGHDGMVHPFHPELTLYSSILDKPVGLSLHTLTCTESRRCFSKPTDLHSPVTYMEMASGVALPKKTRHSHGTTLCTVLSQASPPFHRCCLPQPRHLHSRLWGHLLHEGPQVPPGRRVPWPLCAMQGLRGRATSAQL